MLMYISLVGIVLTFIPVASTAIVDTSSWVEGYFAMNLSASGLITIFATILQALTLSQAGQLPSVYTEGVTSGMAFAGIISSLAAIIATAVTDNQEQSALCFFIIATVMTIGIIGAYYILDHNEIFRNMAENLLVNSVSYNIQKVFSRECLH